MAYNPYAYGNYTPYQYSNMYQQQQPQMQPQQPTMTPPTVHAEIIQVESEEIAYNFPVGAGQTQMFMKRDESAFYVKSVLANGQVLFFAYPRREPEPQDTTPDMSAYVTREEFEQRLNSLIPQKKSKKGEEINESV